jgi:hypothetical protein
MCISDGGWASDDRRVILGLKPDVKFLLWTEHEKESGKNV